MFDSNTPTIPPIRIVGFPPANSIMILADRINLPLEPFEPILALRRITMKEMLRQPYEDENLQEF
jgi:hypothetical protein